MSAPQTEVGNLGSNELKSMANELTFRSSPQATIGVELEFQIIDRESRDLAPGAVRILKECAAEGIQNVTAELMQSMIELKTGVCQNVAEARQEIVGNLRKVRNIASSLGYDLAMGGTHPFHRTGSDVVFPAERYEKIQERLSWLTGQWAFVVGGALAFTSYYCFYEYIHWCMHLPKARRVEKPWWFRRLNGHHLLHHRYMHKNFNVVLPIADLCLGTFMARAKTHFAQATGPSVPNIQPLA